MASNYITEIAFNGFLIERLHGRTSVKFEPGTNILIGPNGQRRRFNETARKEED